MPTINLSEHIMCAVAAIYLYEGESNEALKYFLSHNSFSTKGTQ